MEKSKVDKMIKKIEDICIVTDRDNANVGSNFSAKLLRIASVTNKTINLDKMPTQIKEAYKLGLIYPHDADAMNLTINCLNIETGKILRRGFNTGYGTINPPKRITSAGELSCILLQAAQNDFFGGQAHIDFDNDMAWFVEKTRKELINEEANSYCAYNDMELPLRLYQLPDEAIDLIKKRAEDRLNKCIHQAMQGIIYNLNSMHSRAGSQVPFSSINIGLPKSKDAALVCEILLDEYEKGLGKGEQPIFPNIIFRVKKGINKYPMDPYHYLYWKAAIVASKRMNPTFLNLDAGENLRLFKEGILPGTMGCRTNILTDINGENTPNGRGNIAPTTINLPALAIISKQNTASKQSRLISFFNRLDAVLELAKDSLLYRYDLLCKLKGRDLPFAISQHLIKGSEEIGPEDSIEPILKHGTWAIGFIGLAETLTCLVGKHHGESSEAQELGIKIIEHIREYTNKCTNRYKLNFCTYATPAEGLSNGFLKGDIEKFGIIKGVTDKEFYTNSFHIPVDYKTSIKHKIDIEAPYHSLCNGGRISYIELDKPPYDEPIVITDIVDYAFDKGVEYIGINFGITYCKDCGTNYIQGTHCPDCNSTNLQSIHRVTGYLALDERFGEGKTAEKKARVPHNN